MVSKLQDNIRSRNKFLLALNIFFSGIAMYFSLRILYISLTGIMSTDAFSEVTNTMLFGMIFFLALSNTVSLIEARIANKNDHFTLLLIVTLFMFVVAFMIL